MNYPKDFLEDGAFLDEKFLEEVSSLFVDFRKNTEVTASNVTYEFVNIDEALKVIIKVYLRFTPVMEKGKWYIMEDVGMEGYQSYCDIEDISILNNKSLFKDFIMGKIKFMKECIFNAAVRGDGSI